MRERLQQVSLVLKLVLNVSLESVVAVQEASQLRMRVGHVRQERRGRALEAAEWRLPPPALVWRLIGDKFRQNLSKAENIVL